MFHISFYNIWVSINIYIWRQKSYNMDKQFLCLDSPTDFIVGKYISADELKEFINIRKGSLKLTVNLIVVTKTSSPVSLLICGLVFCTQFKNTFIM